MARYRAAARRLRNTDLHSVTYTRGRIDTVDCPDDQHLFARNMYRIGINKYRKKNCASSWLFTQWRKKNAFFQIIVTFLFSI